MNILLVHKMNLFCLIFAKKQTNKNKPKAQYSI